MRVWLPQNQGLFSKDPLSPKPKITKTNQPLRNQRRRTLNLTGTLRITGIIINPMPITEAGGGVTMEVISEVAEATAMVTVEVLGSDVLFDCELY